MLARLQAFKGNRWQDEALLRDAVRHAAEVGDPDLQASVECEYAWYLGKLGQFATSHAHSERAIELYGEIGATIKQGRVMVNSARCYDARAGDLASAFDFARRGREIAAATGDVSLQAWLAMEAEPCLYQGLWQRTVEIADRDLHVAWEVGNWEVVLFVSAWAAIAEVNLGRLGPARSRIVEARARAGRRIGSDLAKIYPRIASCYVRLADGEREAALVEAHRACDIADRAKYRLEQGAARRVLAQVHEARGERDEAEAEFRRSLDVLGRIQSRPELGQSLLAYGRFRLQDDVDVGRRLLERALALFEEMNATGWIAEARTTLGT